MHLEEQVVSLVNRLPPLPESAARLLEAAVQRNVGPVVEKLLREDPGLCAEFLRFANSACYAKAGPISTVEEALACADANLFAQMVATAWHEDVLRNTFRELPHLDLFFEHSREIRAACRALASTAGCPPDECEFYAIAGLLHDIGRLVMIAAGRQQHTALFGTTPGEMLSIVHDERTAMGMDHCDVGMFICRNWNLSPVLQEGVLRHHSPLVGRDFSRPGAFIFIAHFVAMHDMTGDILADTVPPEIFTDLGLTPAAVAMARRRLTEACAAGWPGGRGGDRR